MPSNTLAKRLIPCLDVKAGRVVKGTNFVNLQDIGAPAELATKYNNDGADELVLLDIIASSDDRNIMKNVVKECASQVFIPFTVGGGIRNSEDIRDMLTAGADKVSINTAAVKDPSIIKESAKRFGSQCIVLAVDSRRVSPCSWEVYIKGGRTPTGLDCIEWITQAVGLGAGEILLTSMDADGTNDGYDIQLTKKVSETVNVPVIASGGAGTLDDFWDVLTIGKADAVLAASIFHYDKFSIVQVKEYLKNRGLEVRV